MASLFDRIVNRLGYERSSSGEKAVKIVKEQYTAVNQADPDEPDKPTQFDTEVGDPGTDTWADLYGAIPSRIDPIELSVYSDMRFGNGTCAAMFRVLQLPILATRFNVTPGPDDKEGKVAAFVERVLTDLPSGDGMDVPMHQVLSEATSSFWAGYKPQEIVWRSLKKGRIGIKKIAPRSPVSTKPVIDQHGNLMGAYQQSNFMNEQRMIFIPREKLWWYVHRMEDGNFYGESDFRAAHPHYETLRKLYVIDNKTHEVTAIPIRVAQPTMGGMTAAQKQDVFNKIKKVGLDTAILLPKDFELKEFGAKNASGSTRRESIDHHTSQMAMSVLAHFLQLGVNGQGTYNLSQDQSDMFLQMISAEMRSLADSFTIQVIEPLVRLNFGDNSGIVPRFVFADMTDHVRKTMETIFLAITQGGGNRLSDEFIEALGKRVANELGLDLSINTRVNDSTPSATKGQAELDEEAMKKFVAQANATGAATAGPGRGNTSGGANQEVSKLRKQSEPDNKGSSKANLSAGVLVETVKKSDNGRDFFGRLKLHLSNQYGVKAPTTPVEFDEYLGLVDLTSPEDVMGVANLAVSLVESILEEVDEGD